MSLCVSDRIKHTEIVTDVTVSQLGGLRPWAIHKVNFPDRRAVSPDIRMPPENDLAQLR